MNVAVPKPLAANATPVRNSLGGRPFLPPGFEWPICPTSKQRMVLFLQFDTQANHKLTLAPNTHVAVFMSPTVNEIHTFETELPATFWEHRLDHFKAYVFGPDVPLVAHADADAYLVPHELEFNSITNMRDPFLMIGGEPRWYQDPEPRTGFDFVCQLSENFPFPKLPNAPEQPNTFSANDYGLFLGNSTYLFTRAKPRHIEEVWIVLQN